jgi:hypothetical protein
MWEKFGQAIFLTAMLGLLIAISGYGTTEGMPTVNSSNSISEVWRSPNLHL